MSTINSVLLFLRDNVFHSGEEIAESLGLTRASVWKAVKLLRNKGLEIHSVRGKGYRLAQNLELLDRSLILQAIPLSLQARFNITTFVELPSTNDYLLDYTRNNRDYTVSQVCLTEHQSGGRGRRGRVWHSPLGMNLYLSLTWKHQLSPRAVSGFSLVTALALVSCLKNLGIDGVELKWPNDVLWQKKKLAGILLELSGESHGEQHLVVGVGVNVDMPENSQNISQPYTSIRQICGKTVSRNKLAGELLTQVIDYYKRYEAEGMSPLIEEWQSGDAYMNKDVELIFPNQVIRGKVAGIDEYGSLLLDLDGGGRQAFQSGEISLRSSPNA